MPRVPYSKWVTMTPAQQARQRASVSKAKPRYRARSSPNKSLMTLTNTPVLSIKHRSKLLYSDSRLITFSGAASNAYVYSANGLFDPDITGIGHQPMGFDQLIALYEHYTVLNAKVTVSFVNESTTDPAYVGIAAFPDTTPETVPSKLVENGLLKRVYVAANSGNPKSNATLTFSVKISRINGRPESIVADDLFRGDSASNPSEQTYLHVFGYNLTNGNSVSVRADTLIEYDAVFTEPRKLTQS